MTHFIVDAWSKGSCVWFARCAQRRAVVRHVEIALADHCAETIFISKATDGQTAAAIAQVMSGGFWKWQGKRDERLIALVESE